MKVCRVTLIDRKPGSLVTNAGLPSLNDQLLDFRRPGNKVWLISLIDTVAGAYLLPFW